jgi:hypothetical protein
LKLDQKNAFSGFCQKFPQAMDEVEKFFCQFPNPWALRVSGMGGYTSKCEKKSKSLHPNLQFLTALNNFSILMQKLLNLTLHNYVMTF